MEISPFIFNLLLETLFVAYYNKHKEKQPPTKWLASNQVTKKATRPAKTRVAFLFSLGIPIYVGKQCNQESTT